MAVATSLKPAIANPVTIALWGLIVAAMLVPGSLPLLMDWPLSCPSRGTPHGTCTGNRCAGESRQTLRPMPAHDGKRSA